MRMCCDCKVAVVCVPARVSGVPPFPSPASLAALPVIAFTKATNRASCLFEPVRRGGFDGSWFGDCRTQQPVPQQRPSSVPQQHALREVLATGLRGFADTGAQMPTALVLTASIRTTATRIGFSRLRTDHLGQTEKFASFTKAYRRGWSRTTTPGIQRLKRFLPADQPKTEM